MHVRQFLQTLAHSIASMHWCQVLTSLMVSHMIILNETRLILYFSSEVSIFTMTLKASCWYGILAQGKEPNNTHFSVISVLLPLTTRFCQPLHVALLQIWPRRVPVQLPPVTTLAPKSRLPQLLLHCLPSSW